jgi:hypothetical protein
MREKISFKGVIWGAIADVGGSNVWGFIAAIYIAVHYHIYSLPAAQQSNKIMEMMTRDPLIFTLNTIIGSGFSILGGYVAARIAKHNELLNAVLSSFLCEIFGIFAFGSPLYPVWMILTGLVTSPLLGLAGGYMQLWQERKVTKKHPRAK